MPTAIFEIEKEGELLSSHTIEDFSVVKEKVDSALLEMTGLNPSQY